MDANPKLRASKDRDLAGRGTSNIQGLGAIGNRQWNSCILSFVFPIPLSFIHEFSSLGNLTHFTRYCTLAPQLESRVQYVRYLLHLVLVVLGGWIWRLLA